MASQTFLLFCGTFLTILLVSTRSAPIEKTKETSSLPVINSNLTPATLKIQTNSESQEKNKRQIDDDDLENFSNYFFQDDEQFFHPEMRETSAQIHDNGQHPTDIDESNVFSDLRMNPSELSNIVRERRDLRLDDHDNRRRKRATFSPFEIYDDDQFYNPWIDSVDEDTYVRPSRSLAPIFWFPSVSKRNLSPREFRIENLVESEPEYSTVAEIDDDDQFPVLNVDDEVEDDDNEDEQISYEYYRYPILVDLSRNPFDNLQLQQNYNDDDFPFDENEIFDEQQNEDDDEDDDEPLEQYPIAYESESPNDLSYERFEKHF